MTTTLTTTATSARHGSSSTFGALGGFDPITTWDALRAPPAVREAAAQALAAPDRDAID